MVVSLFVLSCLFGACRHYHADSMTRLPFQSIYIEPVENESILPQAQVLLSDQIVQSLLREYSHVIVTNREDADVTLLVVLKKYERIPTVTREKDTYLGRFFSLELTADCTLFDNATGESYFENHTVVASAEACADGGNFQPSEYNAIPTITYKLALKIKNLIVSTWS